MAGPDKATAEVAAAIRAAKVDLTEVHAALRAVTQDGTASLEWVLDLDQFGIDGLAQEITAGTMTLGEMVDVAEATGQGWESIDPINDVRHAHAVLTAITHSRVPSVGSRADAVMIVDKVPVAVFEEAYSLRENKPADPT